MATFDRLARIYRPLEFVAFGGDLERARFRYLPRLESRRNILLLGEGDGRSLRRLLSLVPHARVTYVDGSAQMLQRAKTRLNVAELARVTFSQANVLTEELPPGPYDAVTTFFFLDCFTDQQVRAIVTKTISRLAPDALWLFADFVLPARGVRRWRARVWLALLYAFFQRSAGLAVNQLPASEAILTEAGFRPTECLELQHGMLRTAVYRR